VLIEIDDHLSRLGDLCRYLAPVMPKRFTQFKLASAMLLIAVLSVWFAYREYTKAERALRIIEAAGGRIELTNDDATKIEQISFQGNAQTTNLDLTPIRDLRDIYRIDLDYTQIDDISPIRGQINLRWLDLEDTHIDSDDLMNLANLNKLHTLVLTGTKISDRGLEVVSDMTDLVDLRLNNTMITDDCLRHFKNLKKLKELNLEDTGVTIDGVSVLQLDLPNCEIKHDASAK